MKVCPLAHRLVVCMHEPLSAVMFIHPRTAYWPLCTQYGNFSVVHANKWGYLRVAATAKSMRLEFVDNEDAGVFDSTVLYPWV